MGFIVVIALFGAFAAIGWLLLAMLVIGILLLIACLVFAILYCKGKRTLPAPRKWQKIVSIVCAALSAVLILPPVIIYLLVMAM